MAVSMFGQKRLSREGGIEIVVKELCTRMAQKGLAVGIDNYGSRGVAIRKDNKYELNCFVSELCALRLFIGIIPIVIYLWYSIVFGDPKEIYLLQSLILFGTVLNINWCFFGLEKFDITVTRNFIFKFLTVICVFVFVKNSDDLWKYTLIMAAGTVISQSVVWVFFPKYFHFVKTSVSGIVKHVKPLLVLFTAVLANSAYTYIDKIMIGWLGTKSQLGICDNSYKIISFPMGIITALGVVMLPRMASSVTIRFLRMRFTVTCRWIALTCSSPRRLQSIPALRIAAPKLPLTCWFWLTTVPTACL